MKRSRASGRDGRLVHHRRSPTATTPSRSPRRSTRSSPTRRPRPRPRPRRRSSQSFAKQIGNIGAIMLGDRARIVFFVILLVAGNTMAQSVRERTNELGVLKTLGFTDGTVMALVARRVVLLAVLGGALGLGARRRWRSAARRSAWSRASCRSSTCRRGESSSASCSSCCSGSRPAAARRPRRCGCDRRRAAEALTCAGSSQTLAVTTLNLRSLAQRLGSSAVAVVGFAGVVAVFVAVLSIAEGFRRVLESGRRPDIALVLRAGSDTEMSSGCYSRTRDASSKRGAARAAGGVGERPAGVAELFVVVDVPKRRRHRRQRAAARRRAGGVRGARPSVQIVEGRNFTPGRNEVIVGRAARASSRGLDIGTSCSWGENEWRGGRHLRPPAARSASRRSGPTRACCSPPTAAATRYQSV